MDRAGDEAGLLRLEAEAVHSVLLVGDDLDRFATRIRIREPAEVRCGRRATAGPRGRVTAFGADRPVRRWPDRVETGRTVKAKPNGRFSAPLTSELPFSFRPTLVIYQCSAIRRAA